VIAEKAKAARQKIEFTVHTKGGNSNDTGGKAAPVNAAGVNPAALEGLSPSEQSMVKQLAEYRMALPTGSALRSAYWQKILGRTSTYKPEFDASQYNVRVKLKSDFTSGKSANNIRSLNTAIGHLDTLDKKMKALDNRSWQFWNKAVNAGQSALGDPRVRGVLVSATAVESELAAVFKGMGATDQEIKAWRENFSTADSPAKQKEAIKTAIELLGGRLSALTSQYETGLGEPKNFHMLNDKSRSILKRLGADIEAMDPVTSRSGSATSPASTPPTTGKQPLSNY